MRVVPGELEADYASALRDYLASPAEAALQRAYEFGRKALDQGLGVLGMVGVHQAALAAVLAEMRGPEESAAVTKMAGNFFLESLGPFEMTHRGFREANVALLRLNETLEQEARRIAHALHDEAGQFLACIYIALDEIGRDLPAPSRERLQEVRNLLDQIEEQLRRLSHELRPTVLDDLGLMPALEFVGEGVSKRAGIPVFVEGPRDGRLPFIVETTIYRIVQEALNNISKHSRAAHAWIRIWRDARAIRCSVKDDGVGFDVDAEVAKRGRRGLGLIGIRERLEALGGALQLKSEPGQGTELLIIIPLEASHAS